MEVETHERDDLGLQETFKSVFPIEDFADALFWNSFLQLETRNMTLKNASSVGSPMHPLRVTLRLVVWEEMKTLALGLSATLRSRCIHG